MIDVARRASDVGEDRHRKDTGGLRISVFAFTPSSLTPSINNTEVNGAVATLKETATVYQNLGK